MKQDELTICSRCLGDACYVDKVNQDITTQFCFSCGFQTNSLMKEGEEFYEQQIALLPELYKDLLNKDDDGVVWMPSTVNVPSQGMIFANGPSKTDWGWAAVKAVPVTDEEKEKYPILGQKGKYYEWRMDMTTLQMFPEREFMDALSYIGVIPE
jgi:hypothetical protein